MAPVPELGAGVHAAGVGDGEADDSEDEQREAELDEDSRAPSQRLVPPIGKEHERIDRMPEGDRDADLDRAAQAQGRTSATPCIPKGLRRQSPAVKCGAMNASVKARSVSIAALASFAALFASPATKQPPRGASWLAAGVANWNHSGAAVPKAPPGNAANRERCKDLLRPPSGVHDRAVTAQGWLIYGSLQRFGRTVVVTGASDLDGMCRPRGFQVFVFFERKFAGTLSPELMNARADGSQTRCSLTRERNISAEYARYSKDDPLCCPSGAATVPFEVEDRPDGPLVVPGQPVSVPVSR